MGIAVSQVQRHTSLESSYIPVELRRDVLKLGHYVCAFCYKKEKHDLCHDIPKARGGGDRDKKSSNLLPTLSEGKGRQNCCRVQGTVGLGR